MLGGQLIETRDLLEAASRIRIMEDRWLLCPMTFRPMTSIAQWRSGTTVNFLMIVGGEAWDEDLVRSLFPQFEANCILVVPLRRPREEDRLIWNFDQGRCFSVCSAYQLDRELEPVRGQSHGMCKPSEAP
ncbi:UNVERIFIED_CONTAM: hypothetical protein Sradi_2524100 [Sesamum radiatum]|uniref:Uncharacterized protein n=1 Tax=Sesamum radiatum TaxID=300843 RepID=A0AAW2SKL8_SESRA